MSKEENYQLVKAVIRDHIGYLDCSSLSDRVIEAMKKVDRGIFTPKGDPDTYRARGSLSIDCGQTCSQPTMVAHMANKLELKPGYTMQEIGTGSAYSAAVHTYLISPGGLLITIERHSPLVHKAKNNLIRWYNTLTPADLGNKKKYSPKVRELQTGFNIEFAIQNDVTTIKIRHGNGYRGNNRYAPYNGIVSTAGYSGDFDDTPLIEQLKKPGILLYPARDGPMVLAKKGNRISRKNYGDARFVPLIDSIAH